MKYDAFISYRHTEPDMEIAKAVHKGLETFKVPHAVRKSSGKKNIKMVFRDQEELPIGSDLTDNIDHALDESEFLIVICSPNTPGSEWVKKEIDYFLAHHSRDHALAVLVDGEPWESFPQALLTDENGNPVEPLAADVRGKKSSERRKKLKVELMRLAAPLLSCTYDDLRQRHKERRMKKLAAAISMIAVAGVAFGLYCAYNARQIAENYSAKLENQSKYLATVSTTLLNGGDRRAAALVAAEALPTEENDRPYVAAAENALAEALHVYDSGDWISFDRTLTHDMPVIDFKYNKDVTMITSRDFCNNVYVWDVETGKRLLKILPELNESGGYPDCKYANVIGDRLTIITDEGIYLYDMDGEQVKKEEFTSTVSHVTFNKDENMAACVFYGGEIRIYSLENGKINLFQTIHAPEDTSYGSGSVFSEDGRYYAISDSALNDEKNVLIYDLENISYKTVSLGNVYVADMIFTYDDHLAVATIDSDSIYNYDITNHPDGLVTVYTAGGSLLWKETIPAGNTVSFEGGFRLYLHYYEGSDTTYHSIAAIMDNSVYTLDAGTGQNYCVIPMNSDVVKMIPLSNAKQAAIACYDGNIFIADLYNGNIYTNSTIEMNMDLMDFQLSKGVLTGRKYASPELYMMKYIASNTKEQFAECEYNSFLNTQLSEDNQYLMARVSSVGLSNLFLFYDTSDGELAGEYMPEDGFIYMTSGYITSDRYAIVDYNGKIISYDIEEDESEELKISHLPDFESIRCLDGKMISSSQLFLYNREQLVVCDLVEEEVKYSVSLRDQILLAAVSADGKYAGAYTSDGTLYYIDMEAEEKHEIKDEVLINIYASADAIILSDDGSKLAVACVDGNLRVYDRESMELQAKIPYANRAWGFVAFSPDSRNVLLQGDDYYFKVYDLEKNEFSSLADSQYYSIQRVEYYGSGMAGLVTTSSLVLLAEDNYEPLANIFHGRAYDPDQQLVYASSYSGLITFPYLNYQQLLEEMERVFPGEELTVEERLRYHID